MNSTRQPVVAILAAGAMAALVANSIHPHRIPWMQDWSAQIEARAAELGIRVIPLGAALELFKSRTGTFVDARHAAEYARGHIAGAVSVPFPVLDSELELAAALVDSGRPLIVYCRSRDCDEALLLAAEFQAMGGSNQVLYVDGFELWKDHGGPVEAP